MLDIPASKSAELKASFLNDDQRKGGAIQLWITTDPLASWRRLVRNLYVHGYYHAQLLAIGDKIRLYCEEKIGMCIHNISPHHNNTPYYYRTPEEVGYHFRGMRVKLSRAIGKVLFC